MTEPPSPSRWVSAPPTLTPGATAASHPPPPLPPEPSIIRATLRALGAWKRLVPILLLSASLVAAQWSFSADSRGVPLGLTMCFLFVVVAPVSWRVLFPERLDLRHGGIRLLLYVAIGVGVVLSVSVVVPQLLGMGKTFLTYPPSMLVSLTLFIVGGWGLGRDIGLERRLAHAESQAAHLAREAERAQLLALRAHLDPHFLFNTLNAIAEWCREDGAVAERAVLELSAMLRVVMTGVRAPSWSLAEELALVETLFSLHRLRDPDRLTFVKHIPTPLPHAAVPPLLLLPLAENAVTHGPNAGHRGPVTLTVSANAGPGDAPEAVLRIVLENPGPLGHRRAEGTGIATVERRLALAYEGRANLLLTSDGARTRAVVTLPLRDSLPGAPV